MFKRKATVVTTEISYRKKFKRDGLEMVFDCEEVGRVARTFDYPTKVTTKRTILVRFLEKMGASITFSLINSKSLFKSDIQEQIKGREYLVTLEATGKINFPFNITNIEEL